MPRKHQYQWNTAHSSEEGDAGGELPSRSRKKRESTALQLLGEELAALPDAALEELPVSANLREAIRAWRRCASHESRRRQMQYVGRLMREESDIPALRALLDARRAGRAENTAAFKKAERLRNELMDADAEALARLLAPFGPPDSEPAAELLELTRKARNEREHGRPPHAFRALFRRLRELFGA